MTSVFRSFSGAQCAIACTFAKLPVCCHEGAFQISVQGSGSVPRPKSAGIHLRVIELEDSRTVPSNPSDMDGHDPENVPDNEIMPIPYSASD